HCPFCSLPPRPPRATPFPYTTLFRSPLAPEARPAHLRLALGVLLVVAVSACGKKEEAAQPGPAAEPAAATQPAKAPPKAVSDERSEEHTSELQSRENLVCRLLLEKKK